MSTEPGAPQRKEHIRPAIHAGYWWNSFVSNGKLYLLSRVGKVGDCLRF